MAQNLTSIAFHSTKSDGTVNALGKVYTYAAGTLTPQSTYTTQAGTVENTNPVILGADGTAEIWLDPALSYRIIEKTSADVAIAGRDVDGIGGGVSSADLSNTSSATLGDALIGVKSTLTGATARTQHAKNADTVHVADFGADPTATAAANTIALNAAFAQVGRTVRLGKGTYQHNTLDLPTCAGIVGESEYDTILKPTAAVTTALSIGSTGPSYLSQFQIDGSLTTGATGLLLGSTLTAVNASSIRCTGFTGTGAKAIWVADLLKSSLTKLTVGGSSGRGMYVKQIDPIGLPTTLHFDSFTASSVTGPGVTVVTGKMLFTNACIESCTEEGVLVDLSVSGADDADIIFNGGWMEQNQGNDLSKYHVVVNAPVKTARIEFNGTYFDTNGTTAAKSVHYSGAAVRSNVATPRFAQSTAGAILVDSSAVVTIDSWSPNFAKTCVSSSGATVIWDEQDLDGIQGAWTAYTPTYTSSSGDAATTFTGPGTVTTTVARYNLVGKTLYLQIQFSGTLNAVTPSFIGVSLPDSLTAQNSNVFTAAMLTNASNAIGYARPVSGVLRFNLIGGGNFTSGAAVGGWFNGVIEVA